MKAIKKTFKYGEHEVTLESGRIARQATGSVMVSMGGTRVLATAVLGNKEGEGFFPLTVNYIEKTYAAGRFPGGFFKRETRPSEKETLTSRLIDRPLRPLFPKHFAREVQVICTVMSCDADYDPDIAAMVGASAALALSGIPFDGPIGAARVGLCEDEYVLNPSHEKLKQSSLNMVVAGSEKAVLMVESESQELHENIMLGAVLFAHAEMQTVIRAIKDLAQAAEVQQIEWEAPTLNEALLKKIEGGFSSKIDSAYAIAEKTSRVKKLQEIKEQAIEALGDEDNEKELNKLLKEVEHKLVRDRILQGKPRIDGRDSLTVRPISIELGLLPNSHGSALFTRGETQVISTVTLGSKRNAQMVDSLEGEYHDSYMLHYNFPPYSVGEANFLGAPKRREIGHGMLAKRATRYIIPDQNEDFTYTIRVVAEVTESNGSSSMASVCGASLAMMDAGVPVKSAVAGVAMGLVKDDKSSNFQILTDILGDEDHLGDMDFKVAGTEDGITALQMDIKIQGIDENIMERALEQAKEARLHILGEMGKVIKAPRSELAENAPSVVKIKIAPSKVRDVIGKGGATIRGMIEELGVDINIDQEGTVDIFGSNKAKTDLAVEQIGNITFEPDIGKSYDAEVKRIIEIGAFVAIAGTKCEGLVHISKIKDERIDKVEDHLQVGDKVRVKLVDKDHLGRLRLSIKDASNNF